MTKQINLNSADAQSSAQSLSSSLNEEQANASKGLLVSVKMNKENVFVIDNYSFITSDASTPEEVHPNLWEQAKLNMNYGLFRVNRIMEDEEPPLPNGKYSVQRGDVFQIRGFDLANMTIVFDGEGWIVMDCLTVAETAEAAWKDVVQKYLNDAEIKYVVYSHSHIDHYGGVGGLKEFFDKERRIIIAPEGFTQHAVSENIYAGAAMQRRAVYQYGNTLSVGETGQVDAGLGKRVATGTSGIIQPDREYGFSDYLPGKDYIEIDTRPSKDEADKYKGLTLQIQFTPGTEAPAEMNVYMPEYKVLFIAENCAGTLHNLLTPRGAQVRDALAWANYLDRTLTTFTDVETVCSAHNWPHFTHDGAVRFIEIQRDMYRYLNNATLRLVNLGYTIDEVGRMIADGELPLPKDFANEWCCHGFYGTLNHDAKAVYQRYIGWFDGNPAHLNRHKPTDRADRYISEFGAGNISKMAEQAMQRKDYAWAAELYDYIFNASSGAVKDVIEAARKNYAETLQQMGFESEAASWRNMYLTGAKEIANAGTLPKTYIVFQDDTINAMSLEMILQYMGIMLDCGKVETDNCILSMNIQVETRDGKGKSNYEYATANVKRGVLNYRIFSAKPDVQNGSVAIRGEKLAFFRAFVDADLSKLSEILPDPGNYNVLANFIQKYLTRFPINFPIMTPKKIIKMNAVTENFILEDIRPGYFLFWSLCTSCLYECEAKLTDDKGKEYFHYHKYNDGKIKMTPLGQGNAQFTGNTLILEITCYTTVKGIRQCITSHAVIDTNGKKVGYGYDVCVEDETDNDFNDLYINIVGWVSGK